MILAIDIGNSNVCIGVYDGRAPVLTARASTNPLSTETEWAIFMMDVFRLRGFDLAKLTGAAISSVVPALTTAFERAVKALREIPIVTVAQGVRTGINIRIEDPASTGADLVCTAAGAAAKYPLPAVIVDLGTATKITVVTERRDFIGGAIMPGVMVSLSALSRSTAQLPFIGVGRGDIRAIGSNTVECMTSGSVLGTADMIDGMVARFVRELGGKPTVVACGGLAESIVPYCSTPIVLDKDLLLDGLVDIYLRNAAE